MEVGLRLPEAPGAEDDSADGEGEEGPAHVDQNKRPGVGFESGEHGDRCILREEETEPADERDLQSGKGMGDVELREEPGQGVIDHER